MSGRCVRIEVSGEPVGQGRPKFSTVNGFAMAYDPAKSRHWKDYAKLVAQNVMGTQELLSGELALSIRVYRTMPKSISKKKQALALAGEIRPVTKPDLDNYVKGAVDALKGVVFRDDSAIVAFHEPFGKWYSDRPRVEIEVKEI